MAEATVDIMAIAVPVDDGQITRALTDVDEKLAVWAEAMLDAERLMASVAARVLPRSPATELEPAAETPVAGAPAAPTMTTSRASAMVEAEQPRQTGQPRTTTTTGAAAGEPEGGPARKAHRDEGHVERPETPETPRPDVTPIKFTGAAPPQTKAPPPASPPSEDEQLLASLDPETAKAIKVMRRLAPSKRSVKELLEEYEANKANAKPPKPEKRSWFSRGR